MLGFGIGEREKIYIASADFMTRNTLRRVEVAVPIYDEDIKERLRHIFDTVMSDNVKGRVLNKKGDYERRFDEEHPVNSQEFFCKEAENNA